MWKLPILLPWSLQDLLGMSWQAGAVALTHLSPPNPGQGHKTQQEHPRQHPVEEKGNKGEMAPGGEEPNNFSVVAFKESLVGQPQGQVIPSSFSPSARTMLPSA